MKAINKIMALSLLFLGLAACKEKEVPQSLANIKITTNEVTAITATSAVSGGEITDNGGYTITKRGVCWGASENPTLADNKTSEGDGDGAFTSTINGIEPGKTYHVRAYAQCSAGVAYGNDVAFTSLTAAPSVRTVGSESITINSFVVKGEVSAANGSDVTEVGIYYGDTSDPGNKVAAAVVENSFSVEVTGLVDNTKYYVKAYAVNSVGTGYGEVIEVTTSEDPVVAFADAALQDYMSYVYGDDGGNVRKSVADTITVLDIANQGIASLEGIKSLTALKTLVANNNKLGTVDLSGMTALEYVDISWNKVALGGLNVDGCTSLKTLLANDPADATGPESFAPDAPALETLNVCVWHNLKTLDLSKCASLKWLDACQLYSVTTLDFTHCPKLEHVWMPNSNALTSIDLTGCKNLIEFIANDSYEVEEFKIDGPQTLKVLNINCFRKITSLDLTNCVNLESLDAIQLYACSDFKLPSDLSHCTYMWLADMLVQESLTFKNLPSNARVKIWNCPALKTLNYETAQEVVGWNYGDDPKTVTDTWGVPGNNITAFNIKAPNAKKLYCSNLHLLPSLDLSQCPNLEYICMPDLWVMTSVDLSKCTKLKDLWIWAAKELTVLDVSKCATVMNEINADNCAKLTKIILKTGQTITTVNKPGTTVYEYVD